MKLEEYQKRNEDLKEKYLVHERMHSYQNEYKKEKDLKFEDIEKRRKIDDGTYLNIYYNLKIHIV